MFRYQIGPHITEVECPLVEDAALGVEAIDSRVAKLQADVAKLLEAAEGAPRIEFTIGPISEQS